MLSNSIRQPLFWMIPLACGSITYSLLSANAYGWLAALIVGAASSALIPYSSGRTAIKMPGLLDPITYSFASEGVTFEYKHGKNSADWSLVKGAYETSRFIFIKMQWGGFHLIPLRQITSDQAAAVRRV